MLTSTHIALAPAETTSPLVLPFSLPIVALFDLQVQDFNKPAITESHMADNQPNTRHSKLKPNPFKSHRTFSLLWSAIRPLQEYLDQPTRNQTQGTLPTLAPNIAAFSIGEMHSGPACSCSCDLCAFGRDRCCYIKKD